jgi:hypothetical protein
MAPPFAHPRASYPASLEAALSFFRSSVLPLFRFFALTAYLRSRLVQRS